MTTVTLDVKQVKFVVFLHIIGTTEMRPDLAILHSVVIADIGPQSGYDLMNHWNDFGNIILR